MSPPETLQQLLTEELGNRTIAATAVPLSIKANLNPSFPLRPYQVKAFQLFTRYWEEEFTGKGGHNHQLLFHMATGSGKTLIMAGLVLYLYSKGYRNFLFFVNSTNIIDKTRDNFKNRRSRKYLFADEIVISGEPVRIRELENFQVTSTNDINLVFQTIQGLHSALNDPRENALTADDFTDQPMVLISDEAHHMNVDTRRRATSGSQGELWPASWEGTVEQLFRANPGNVLLEFTATMDLADERLALKYKPKLIFDYPLRDFRRDGYSKEVKVLQADLPPLDRGIQAALLSQYRRKLFEKHGLHVKPVILFKAKTINESKQFQESFTEAMCSLSGAALEGIESRTSQPELQKVFSYLREIGLTLENFALELKVDFSAEKFISVNSKEESEAKQLAVNSLEDADNEFRAVFAVDKLNEGWDVLNLFDIVRLYDTRDSRAGRIGKTTMSEAQLIGRGARYFPFVTRAGDAPYERKYDLDIGNELRVCEELYYHSAYNPRYIQELDAALREVGIKAKETREVTLKLKDSFTQSATYRSGHIYLNSREKRTAPDGSGLDAALLHTRYSVTLRTGFSQSSVAFEEGATNERRPERYARDFRLIEFGFRVLRKAIQRNQFYQFDNLGSFFPGLGSIHEFITSENYLAGVVVEVVGMRHQIEALDPEEKVAVITVVLGKFAEAIVSRAPNEVGSERFRPHMIRETFREKSLNFMIDDVGDREFGRAMSGSETAYHLHLPSRDWYVFDENYGTSEEKAFLLYLDKRYDKLKGRFSQIYVIRNEKNFQLFNFDDGRALEPDFVLLLIAHKGSEPVHYQIFIEPKGNHLLKTDEWKERFLTSIKSRANLEQLFNDEAYAVWGLPFFNEELENNFSAAFEILDTDQLGLKDALQQSVPDTQRVAKAIHLDPSRNRK